MVQQANNVERHFTAVCRCLVRFVAPAVPPLIDGYDAIIAGKVAENWHSAPAGERTFDAVNQDDRDTAPLFHIMNAHALAHEARINELRGRSGRGQRESN